MPIDTAGIRRLEASESSQPRRLELTGTATPIVVGLAASLMPVIVNANPLAPRRPAREVAIAR
jgi:hypothetical protein